MRQVCRNLEAWASQKCICGRQHPGAFVVKLTAYGQCDLLPTPNLAITLKSSA